MDEGVRARPPAAPSSWRRRSRPAPRQFALGARATPPATSTSAPASPTAPPTAAASRSWTGATGERRSSTKADLADVTAHAGLPRLDLVLVADRQRRRLRRDGAAARDRGRLEQHEQASDGHGAGRGRWPGAAVEMATRRGRRGRRAPPPAGHERPHRHGLALLHDRDGIEAGLVFAEAGIPVCYVTMPNLGTTAPATKAGAFVAGRGRDRGRGRPPPARSAGRPGLGSIMQIYADPRTAPTMTVAARRPLPLPRDRAAARASACRRSGRSAAPTPSVPGTWQAGVETDAAAPAGAARRLRDLHRHRPHQHLHSSSPPRT